MKMANLFFDLLWTHQEVAKKTSHLQKKSRKRQNNISAGGYWK